MEMFVQTAPHLLGCQAIACPYSYRAETPLEQCHHLLNCSAVANNQARRPQRTHLSSEHQRYGILSVPQPQYSLPSAELAVTLAVCLNNETTS